MTEMFNPQQFADQFSKTPTAVPAVPVQQPVYTQPALTVPNGYALPPTSAPLPVYPSPPHNPAPAHPPVPGGPQPQNVAPYPRKERKTNAHFFFKLVKNPKSNREFVEAGFTKQAFDYLTTNPQGEYKLRIQLFENEMQTIRATGQGYGEKIVGMGYLVLNSKGWQRKYANQQTGNPQQFQPNG